MSALIYLIPAALFLGLLGLAAFLWSMRSGQYDDLDGAAQRILFDEDDQPPAEPDDPPGKSTPTREQGRPDDAPKPD